MFKSVLFALEVNKTVHFGIFIRVGAANSRFFYNLENKKLLCNLIHITNQES